MKKNIMMMGILILLGVIGIVVAQNHIKIVPPVELDTKEVKIVEGNILVPPSAYEMPQLFFALPKGQCDVTAYGGRTGSGSPGPIKVSRAKDATTTANTVTCTGQFTCSGTFAITLEYYMVKVDMINSDFKIANLAYQCGT